MGSVDGVKMIVESTVTGNHMKDGSVAQFFHNVVVVKLTNVGEFIRSNDRVGVSMFVSDPFGAIVYQVVELSTLELIRCLMLDCGKGQSRMLLSRMIKSEFAEL